MSHPADAPAVHNAIVLIPARTFIVYRGSRQTEYKLDNQCADGRSHCWSQAAIGLASPDDDTFGDAGIAQETPEQLKVVFKQGDVIWRGLS
jgi:hypothetical protein